MTMRKRIAAKRVLPLLLAVLFCLSALAACKKSGNGPISVDPSSQPAVSSGTSAGEQGDGENQDAGSAAAAEGKPAPAIQEEEVIRN